MARPLPYLDHYPLHLREQVRELIAGNRLGEVVRARYPDTHAIGSNQALYDYVQAKKRKFLVSSPPLSKVRYCDKISTLNRALGLHTHATRIHGAKARTKHEIRVASVFRSSPAAFLELVVVHELAHLREREHDKAFYRLCQHMLPDYHQIEFDMRLWLTWLDLEAEAKAGPE